MARLTITDSARTDLHEIHSQIAKDKPEAARRFVEKLRDNARRLAETPGMGRKRGEDLRPGLFSYPIGQYILFYCKQLDGIVLVRVIHGSRDLPSLF